MAKGQVKDIKDEAIIKDLLEAGYIEEVKIKNEIKKEAEKIKEDDNTEVATKKKTKK